MKIYQIFLFIIILTSIYACKTSSIAQQSKLQTISKQYFQEDEIEATTIYNKSQDFALCYKEMKGTSQNPSNTLKYFIYDVSNESIVYESSLDGGYVKWLNDDEVEIFVTPGLMPQNTSKSDFATYFNVRTKEMTTRDIPDND